MFGPPHAMMRRRREAGRLRRNDGMRLSRNPDPPPSVRHLFALFFSDTRPMVRAGRAHDWFGSRRVVCAALAFGLVSAQAADKAFKRDDLADAAIKLEAQIKAEAGAGDQAGPRP